MAITALISVVAYTGYLLRFPVRKACVAQRACPRHQSNLALLSRDLRQVVNRPVVDEFGQVVPALMGGEMAREPLSLTRAGWHNSSAAPRSTLQRFAGGLKMNVFGAAISCARSHCGNGTR